MGTLKWKRIRLLVTNGCNYHCPFCHNEGQEKTSHVDMMSLKKFVRIVDILADQGLEELNISGGEPFLNKNIVDMISYANDKTSLDISCATNLSLVTLEQINQLKNTRIKLNVQFPYIERNAFRRSTGNGNLEKILSKIQLIRDANIAIGLNTVIQSNNIVDVENIVNYALIHELPLKLLPIIGETDSDSYKKNVYPILQQYSINYTDKGTGAKRWILEKDGHSTSVLYIDSPCFNKDINKCREFAEIRIHPDLTLQTCILKSSINKIDISQDKGLVISQLNQLWNNFVKC